MKKKKQRRALAAKNEKINMSYAQHGASIIKKSLASWLAPAGDADRDILDSLPRLRSRSRDLYMGSPIACAALKSIRSNVIGSGLRMNSTLNPTALGLTPDEADKKEKEIEAEFSLWAEFCDARKQLDFYSLQGLAFLSALLSGDCFAMLPYRQSSRSPYSLKIQLIEGDCICNPLTGLSKNILEGVELDKFGAIAAYWLCSRHPAGIYRGGDYTPLKWSRIEPYGRITGRRQILHVFGDIERPGQRRGVPLLAPVIETLKQLTRYTEAELVAAVVAGMYTVFIKSNSPAQMVGAMPVPGGVISDPERDVALGNGSVVGLLPDESIETANPGRPNANFGAFCTNLYEILGSALELPREVFLKSFDASYSASRGALLEAWKAFFMRRNWFVRAFCQPIYEEFLAEAVALGRLSLPGFFEDPRKKIWWSSAIWTGPTQGQLDPLKEANAAAVRVAEGFSTRTKEASDLSGLKFDDIAILRQREEQQMAAFTKEEQQ